MIPNWYAITGGPSSGKTTTILQLAEKGYHTVAESARILIDQEIAKGKTLEQVRTNEAEFQEKVLRLKIEKENSAPKDRIVFFDRGLPDSIVYYNLCGAKINKDLQKFFEEKRYKAVFFLKQLPFDKDYARTEDEETAQQISKLIKEAYLNLNYKIIEVPVMSVKKRVEFILNLISVSHPKPSS